ncbi:MAG TPA: chemotaxis protein CheW [Candidatus Paceibacterota bacterium]|nr:chemotaxis protein CheW [Verrucomicrobiota bacterium]HSA11169.1 chemotaxis protein CheW [Candidatus Paceibacterota bacterium]
MSTSLRQPDPPATREIEACWNEIGVRGNGSCPKLAEVGHCHSCPTFSAAGVRLLDRPLAPEYRRAWTEHFAQQKVPPASARKSALIFRLGTEWFALHAPAIQEVAEHRPVHSLPHRRQGVVLGLANIRGELVLCVSLGRLLGLDPTLPRARRHRTYERLLVTQLDGDRFVFPVDEVRGIHRYQPADLTEPPATLARSGLSYTRGIVQCEGHAVGLLDPGLLFAALNRSLT